MGSNIQSRRLCPPQRVGTLCVGAAAAGSVSVESNPNEKHDVWLSAGIWRRDAGGCIINTSPTEEDGGLRDTAQFELISSPSDALLCGADKDTASSLYS